MIDEPPEGGAFSPDIDWPKALAASAENSFQQPRGSMGDPSPTEDSPPASRATADVIQQETANDMVANRTLREKYADKAHALAFWCLWWWGCMLVALGFVNGIRGKDLWSDQVIMAVTTGVTVSVLAAFLGVIRGLFPNGNGKDSKKPEK